MDALIWFRNGLELSDWREVSSVVAENNAWEEGMGIA